jgi:hypothetical protein
MKMRSLVMAGIALLVAANASAVLDMYNAPLVQDAYVDSVQTSTTFNSTVLQVQGYGGEDYPNSGVTSEQRSFLMFDVSWLAGKTIVSAEFGIYLTAYSRYSDPSLKLSHIEDGWSQDSLNWIDSLPLSAAATAIGFEEQVDELGRYYRWDVFPDWNAGDLTDGFTSFMLTVSDESLNNYAYFNSGESDGYIPYLHIEYIPEPATLVLLAIGSLTALRRKR